MTPKSPTVLSNLPRSLRYPLLAIAVLSSACDLPAGPPADELGAEPQPLAVSIPRSASGVCGDGVLDPIEQCDDGNAVDDDGCDATCRPSGVAAMSTGDGTSCALTLAGNIKCWGRSELGQLGRGDVATIGDDELPGSIDFVALGGRALQVHTNGEQAFALMEDGSVRAWGGNGTYELGLQHTEVLGDDETPATATVSTTLELGAAAVQLALGADFGCARSDEGSVRCWGSNHFGQLGLGTTEFIGDDEHPAQTPGVKLMGPAVDLAAGAHHACAVLEDGLVQCWGLGEDGQLGYGDTQSIGDDESPLVAGPVDVGGPVVEIVAGGLHTCARLESGALRCWGDAAAGQLGYGDMESIGDDEAPETAGDVPVGDVVAGLAAGWAHTCAVLDGGDLRCWGDNGVGQLGLGHTMNVGDDEAPDAAGAVDLGSRSASAAFSGPLARTTCVVLDGDLRCWGANDVGQLGYGHTLALGDEPLEGGGDLPDIVLIGDDDDS